MDAVLDLILQIAEEYAKSTPQLWDDLVVQFLKRFLDRPGFREALKRRAQERGIAITLPPV